MDRECSRVPVWVGGMTGFAGGWYADGRMVWICRSVIIGLVTSHTGIGGGDIISLVTSKTIIRDRCMGSGERIHVVMIKVGGSPSSV